MCKCIYVCVCICIHLHENKIKLFERKIFNTVDNLMHKKVTFQKKKKMIVNVNVNLKMNTVLLLCDLVRMIE